jgi:iron-sulfur cluster repair protein YtfE (RIC family)
MASMLIQIGSSKEPSDIVDLLIECHQRIRSFIGLAARLADADGNSLEEVRNAAKRVTRYFSEALPLHVADEEENILPRLSGKDTELDATLERMHREHVEHEPHLATLVEVCRVLEDSPQRARSRAPKAAEHRVLA